MPEVPADNKRYVWQFNTWQLDTLNNLEDVNIGAITPLATNDILVYDGVTSSWVNTPDTGLGYLKTDGTNMMLADLNMNVNNIQNCGIIYGPYCEFNSVYDVNIGSQNGPINLTSQN